MPNNAVSKSFIGISVHCTDACVFFLISHKRNPLGIGVLYDAIMPKLAIPGKGRAQTPIRMRQSMGTREGKFAPAQVELNTARVKGC